MPYLFDTQGAEPPLGQLIPTGVLREFAEKPSKTGPLSHYEYFRLCLSSHYLSCATPVPTDVDNQIRRKLWPSQLPFEAALQMTQFVLDSRHWDFTPVSHRIVYGYEGSSWKNEVLSGHLGEWFTVAAAAYCALLQYQEPLAREKRQELLDQIADEVRRHSEIFGSLWRGGDGVGSLKAAANIAHNFGDLDRVMDMWDLSVADPLRLGFYKLSASPLDSNRKLRYLGRLWVAGELYKSVIEGSSMALENHRHFALRKPKCLRQSRSYLIPLGPFFDDWGRTVAKGLSHSDGSVSETLNEVASALIHGWARLPKTIGYGRALKGILEVCSETTIEGLEKIPNSDRVFKTSQEVFEKKWGAEALKEMDDIPSRAR